ncbi:MAG: M24 family metallopeptidase [Planctomycetaceae bacterium]|jgi:Xaa-Pro dipeptidase|nr:M24 family metallopeptidase [Planctomycetaceae bacterium]MDC0273242.1 M24 family metallopeptidase [Planctomycetaceae bacterium]MDG2391735.1 M24 family metallopeptidase [Planctomycetaceae bacterium]
MFSLSKIQDALQQFEIDVWLLYDFRGSNVLARRVLNLPDDQMGSRRCCYAIPAEGEPIKLVHRIESGALDHLPGRKVVYLKWQELEAGFAELVEGHKTVAMEYSPRNANPYISKVDAGTVELIKSLGVEVVDSGNLIQLFEAVWTEQQWLQHLSAGKLCDEAFNVAWTFIAEEVRNNGSVEESAVCDQIMNHFHSHNMTTYHPPIVGVGPHSGDCHYETGSGENTLIKEGDFVLIDLWAKLDEPNSVYADMTRTGFVGESVPEKYTEIFNIVAAARDAAIDYAKVAFAEDRPLQGWEIDDACRKVIEEAGYGQYYVHRTGHNIGQEVHGNGAHMDNLETREERLVLPMTCFSVEPGIYQEEFGVRSEVDVFVDAEKNVHVTYGELQTEVVPILKDF